MEQKRRLAEELAAEKEKRVAHLQQLGVKRLRNQSIARAWSAWHGTWFEVTRKRRLMRQAGAYLVRPKLVSAYSSWRRDWEDEQVAQRSMTHEQQLKAEGRAYKAGQFPFMANGRALGMNAAEGFVKVLADALTDEVLGVHIVGHGASDLISEAAVAMEFKASSEDIARVCHPHPSMSEVMREAALAVDKRALNM
jgi:hypothetical protein